MDIGIGLPSTIEGCAPSLLLDWAATAEERGFATLSVADRLVYGNLDPLITLAAVAAVTDRIKLMTSVLLAPLRSGHVELAKQVATIDRISEGRLTLGLGVGSRRDDYEAAGVEFHRRGRILDAQLETMTSIWRSTAGVGPEPATAGGPRLAFGGQSDATFIRVARHGAGWIAGGGNGGAIAATVTRARGAWSAAGREGEPRIFALSHFGLGANGADGARRTLGDYYAFRGPVVEQVIATCLLDDEAIAARIADLTDAGCDEALFTPVIADLDQIDLLAEAIGEQALAH